MQMPQAQPSFRVGKISLRQALLLVLYDLFPPIFDDRVQYFLHGEIRLWQDVDVESSQFGRPL